MTNRVQQAILLHRAILGLAYGDNRDGDHRNRDRLDCRRSNLRVVPKLGNRQNVPSRGGTSRYRGVTWFASRNKWMARLQVNGKPVHIGYFADEHEAGAAALAARQRLMPYALD
jgi:hypothetical protein